MASTDGESSCDRNVEIWKIKKLIKSLEAARGWVCCVVEGGTFRPWEMSLFRSWPIWCHVAESSSIHGLKLRITSRRRVLQNQELFYYCQWFWFLCLIEICLSRAIRKLRFWHGFILTAGDQLSSCCAHVQDGVPSSWLQQKMCENIWYADDEH